MRAVVCRELGGLDCLTFGELPDPEAGVGEVLIEVTAAGLNFADLLIIKGEYQEKPDLPFAPGLEIAGRIARVVLELVVVVVVSLSRTSVGLVGTVRH